MSIHPFGLNDGIGDYAGTLSELPAKSANDSVELAPIDVDLRCRNAHGIGYLAHG